jgi:hypothetical protein
MSGVTRGTGVQTTVSTINRTWRAWLGAEPAANAANATETHKTELRLTIDDRLSNSFKLTS